MLLSLLVSLLTYLLRLSCKCRSPAAIAADWTLLCFSSGGSLLGTSGGYTRGMDWRIGQTTPGVCNYNQHCRLLCVRPLGLVSCLATRTGCTSPCLCPSDGRQLSGGGFQCARLFWGGWKRSRLGSQPCSIGVSLSRI
ncbi:unnamed protein product, partial [Ectocarpus sp. 8 AP-2014]